MLKGDVIQEEWRGTEFVGKKGGGGGCITLNIFYFVNFLSKCLNMNHCSSV